MNYKSSWDVLVVGSINSDFLVRGPSLPRPGETLAGESFFEGPGGKGANQAVAAARLGARVALAGRVGSDARGDTLVHGLENEGVDTRFVARDQKSFTGAAVIMVDENGEKQILAAAGANRGMTVQDVRAAFRSIEHVGVVLMQFEVPLAVVTEAARLGRSRGARVFLDPAPPLELTDNRLLSLLDVIRLNGAEARALTGIPVRDRASARKAAASLMKRGVRSVILPAGDGEDLLVWSGGERCYPRLSVPCVDATGAGDAFAGALAAAMAEGQPLEGAVSFATAAAALSTTKVGAQTALPRRLAVLRLLRSR